MEDSDDTTMPSPQTIKSESKGKVKDIVIQIAQIPILISQVDGITPENSKKKHLQSDGSCERLNKEGEKSSSLGENEGAEIIENLHENVKKQPSDSEEALVDKNEKVLAMKEGLGEVGEPRFNEILNVDLVQLSENNEKIASFEQPSNLKVEKELATGGGSTKKGKESNTAVMFMQGRVAETVSEFDDSGLDVQLDGDLSLEDEEDNNVSSNEVVFLKGDGEKGEAITGLADEVVQENAEEKHQDFTAAHLNEGLPQVDEKDDRKFKSHDLLVVKGTKVLSLDNAASEGESLQGADEIMHVNDEEKHPDVFISMSSITERPIVKHEKLSTMHYELDTEVEKPFSLKEEGQTNSTCEPSVCSLHVNKVKEQHLEEQNAGLLVGLDTKDDNSNPVGGNFVPNDENSVHMDEGLLAGKSEINMSINDGMDKKEKDKGDEDESSLLPESLLDNDIEDTKKQEKAEEMNVGEDGPAAAAGKRSTVKQKSAQPKKSHSKKIKTEHKPKLDESLCFVCYDGGDLVVCDHRTCPKVYHPLCINRNEAYFKAKGKWMCGWHICDNCGKNAHYMCYTCTHSLCKDCLKNAEFEFACVRGNKGFCEDCISTVLMIETEKGAGQTMETGVVDGMSLFKDYWLEENEKISLTLEELTRASTQMNTPNTASTNNKETLNKIRAGKRKVEPSENKPEKTNEGQVRSSSCRLKRNKETTSAGIKKLKQLKRAKNNCFAVGWASKELLNFVAHMKDGDKSELSQFDVQELLLAYIKQNNLRDPSKQSQIICDARLLDLFGQERVGHLEMLKLLESHFLIKETSALAADENQGGVVDPEPSQMDTDGISDTVSKTISDRKEKTSKNTGEKVVTSVEEYAAIDVHNVSKMYLRRSSIENLLDDADTFNDHVVGAFVRIRINWSSSNKDTNKEMYRLVQVVGTGKAADIYNIGKKTSDVTLEVLNLNKREFLTINLISDQEFTEGECKRLRQSVRCGLVQRVTVAQAQEKANALHAVKVNDLLESEKLRLSNLRDHANEQGRTKDHRSSVEKLQLLSSPEELSRRLNKLPEIHVDTNMDLDYTTTDDDEEQIVKSRDLNKISRVSFWDSRKNKSIPNNKANTSRQVNSSVTPKAVTLPTNNNRSIVNNTPVQPSTHTPETPQSASANATKPTIGENEKIWHYQDPAGKIQGPFSMTVLRKWNSNKFFPANLQIWRMSEKQQDSILLTDALDGKVDNVPKHINQTANVEALNDSSSSTRQFQQHRQNNEGQNRRWNEGQNRQSNEGQNRRWNEGQNRQSNEGQNRRWNEGQNRQSNEGQNHRWNEGQNRQNNWNSNRPDKRFQSNNNNSNNNRGFGGHNSYQNSRNHQMNMKQQQQQQPPPPSNVAPQLGNNINWAMLQGAINSILPVQPSPLATLANGNSTAFLQPANLPVQQQQISNNSLLNAVVPQQMNMSYPAVPNAMNMNWGMMPQAPMNMNMSIPWGQAQPNMNPGWVMPPQGMPTQINPALNSGWAAPVVGMANPNASWAAPQALGAVDQTASYQGNPGGAANQVKQ